MKENIKTPKSRDTSSSKFNKVKVCLVLGHTATRREEITSNEKTHDWKFYVKGEPGAKVECFIDRVIFTLHDSFPNPVQTIKQPPYEIVEQGYGTFLMQVEVKFKNKRSPKNIHYKYDLLLPGPGVAPIKKSRKEILTFTNPNPEFMAKLLDGGGQLLTYLFDADGNLVSEEEAIAQKEGSKSGQMQKPKEASNSKEKAFEKEKKPKKHTSNKYDTSEHHSKKGADINEKKRPPDQLKPKGTRKESPKPLASVLASIGDIESSDEDDKEKYFKDSSPKPVSADTRPTAAKSKVDIRKKPKHKQPKTSSEPSFLEFDNLESLKQTKKSFKQHKKETLNQKRKKFIKDMTDDEMYPKEKIKKTDRFAEGDVKKSSKSEETVKSADTDTKKAAKSVEVEVKKVGRYSEAETKKSLKVTASDLKGSKSTDPKNIKSHKPNLSDAKVSKSNETEANRIAKSNESTRKNKRSTSESDVKTPLSDVDPDETAKWFQSPDTTESKYSKPDFSDVVAEKSHKVKKNKHKICKQLHVEASPLSASPQSSPVSLKGEKNADARVSPKNEKDNETNEQAPSEAETICPMTDDEIILRLTVYQKISLLQDTSNKKLLSEVINLIQDDIISFGDGKITFDVLKCDIQTLKTIDGMLSR